MKVGEVIEILSEYRVDSDISFIVEDEDGFTVEKEFSQCYSNKLNDKDKETAVEFCFF